MTVPPPAKRTPPQQRLRRVLGLPQQGPLMSTGMKTALFFAGLAIAVLAVWLIDPQPTLKHVDVAMLSGAPSGNYHAIVGKVAGEAARQRGRIRELASAGSVENVTRLAASAEKCDVHFALVQDGMDWPKDHGLALIGRLPRPEAFVLLSRAAERFRTPQDFKGLRLGIGPEGSGTHHLSRRVLSPLDPLAIEVSSQPIDTQLDLLERGALDVGAIVIDPEAQLLKDAVVKRGLGIIDIPEAASLARRLPFARVGRIEAGQLDYVNRIPPTDRRVLEVDTLVVGNGCASRSDTQGVMSAIAEVFPAFVRHNRGQANLTGLPLDPAAKTFFDEEGPDLVGRHAPWVTDIMPTATWLKLIFAFSVLFSGMALWHRVRLWRLDAARVDIEEHLRTLFDPGITVGDILELEPTDRQRTPEARAALDDAIARLTRLSDACREKSLALVVPMGEEWAYRLQEAQIGDLLHSLRAFRERLS